MKRISLAVAAALSLAMAPAAFAHNGDTVGGGVVVGGELSGFAGSVVGSAGSVSNGNAVTAAQVGGNGASYQSAWGNTGGTATIGGTANQYGATVGTATTQYSNSNVVGHAYGNAPTNVGDSIANGGAAYGNTTTAAAGNANFATGAIGAVGAIGGIASVSFIH